VTVTAARINGGNGGGAVNMTGGESGYSSILAATHLSAWLMPGGCVCGGLSSRIDNGVAMLVMRPWRNVWRNHQTTSAYIPDPASGDTE